jgi:glycosyltransferase involved in cell wall biosynthesis
LPHKNLERLARALAGLDCVLEVIGPLNGAQRALLDGLGVRYEQHDSLPAAVMPAAYRRAAVLVFASLYEGFGLPILESQASGTPVITSDREPMREVAGDGALLVNPEDEQAIRAAVQQVVSDAALRAGLVERGLINAARYSAEEAARAYAGQYAALHESPGGIRRSQAARVPGRQ